MNFLAHCALAHDAAMYWQCTPAETEALLAGAIVGDFCKGPIDPTWPAELNTGVRIHRRIDALSNVDDALKRVYDTYPSSLRRFAPIFVDLIADHALSLNWSAHYAFPRQRFAQECYQALAHYADFLPPRGHRFMRYLQEADLLSNYHDPRLMQQGIEAVLRRLRRSDLNEQASEASLAAVPAAIDELENYLNPLRTHWQNWQTRALFDASFS